MIVIFKTCLRLLQIEGTDGAYILPKTEIFGKQINYNDTAVVVVDNTRQDGYSQNN